MIKKIRNYFWVEEAEASASDKAVIGLVTIALALGAYAISTMFGGI